MDRKRINKILWAIVPIAIAIFSIFVFSKIATSPDTYKSSIESLDIKRDTVLKLTAASTTASTLISALPNDLATPIATKLADLSFYFIIVLSALLLEKYLLTISGFATFYILIPIACALFAAAILTEKDTRREVSVKIGCKIMAVALAVFLVVPLSVRISGAIENTYNQSIEAAVEETIDTAENWNEDLLKTDVKSGKTANFINNFVEYISVMIVTSCLIPILVLIFLIWICKMIFGLNLNFSTAIGKGRDMMRSATAKPGQMINKASEKKAPENKALEKK